MRKYSLRTAIPVLVAFIPSLLLDQLLKLYVVSNMEPGSSRTVIPGLLKITLVRNPGAAFGMFSSKSHLFIPLSVIVLAATVLWVAYTRLYRRVSVSVALGFIWAGAVGNVIDRVFRGTVIDFLDLGWWPVFNVADVTIVVGVIILLVAGSKWFFFSKKEVK